MTCRFLFFLFLSGTVLCHAQQNLLQSGPMVGYAEMKEVMLWVQTKTEAKVKIAYWSSENNQKYYTREIITKSENAYTAKLLADKVLPGNIYYYEVMINGKKLKFNYRLEFQTQAHYQKSSDAPDFSFAAGSCAYVNDSINDLPGKPFGGNYEIYNTILAKKPSFMLWLGDNFYLRQPDWNTKTGIQYRFTHSRSLPELQPLMASVHHYAILDDHDYGPDDSDRSFWNKNASIACFNDFWCNPNTNLTGKGGITGTFHWNDAQFFLMDNRWFRSPNKRFTGKRELLGPEQVEWLLDALSYSRATFKFICIGDPVLNPVMTKENYVNYSEERDYLLKSIEKAKITGVVFLSGDRHFTEITKLSRDSTYPLYDITISPLLSRVYKGAEQNDLQEPGTRYSEKNFGIFKIEGAPASRKLNITIYSTNGEKVWSRDILAKDLK